MEPVTVFRTSDGAAFETESQAMEHETLQGMRELVNNYTQALISAGFTKNAATRAAKAGVAFKVWETTGAVTLKNVKRTRKGEA